MSQWEHNGAMEDDGPDHCDNCRVQTEYVVELERPDGQVALTLCDICAPLYVSTGWVRTTMTDAEAAAWAAGARP